MTTSPEMIERAWSAIVGADISAQCHNASITRGDLKTGIDAAMVGYVVYPCGPSNKVTEIVQPYRGYISSTPELMSLLYDIDMLPEQTISVVGAVRLAAFCEVWKRMEAARCPQENASE
jgi:hypothetical protein